MTDLQSRLAEIASTPILLVGCDFDGTLAPIVLDPGTASADSATLGALLKLHEIPGTRLAVISGRSLEDLRVLVGDAPEILLVGGHGVEWDSGPSAAMASQEQELLARVAQALDQVATGIPGATVERKRSSVALHYRRSTTEDGLKAVHEALAGPGTWPGVHVRSGTMVLELAVLHASKGKALQTLRERVGATAVLFVGDDQTDEEAFATLRAPDLGVKVGPGSTVAEHRISSPAEVASMLAQLATLRRSAAHPAPAVPIADHALLSDQRTVALVTPRGRISWLCVPRIDSSAIMADLVGGPDAGYFDLTAQTTGRAPAQSYEGDSFVLKTDWGGLAVFDYLDCSAGRPFQRAGRTDLMRVVEGEGPFRVVFAPRLDFGRVATRLVATPAGIDIQGAVDPMVLHAPGLRWRILDDGRHQTAIAAGRVERGKPVVLELRYGTRNLKPAVMTEPDRRAHTVRFWSAWAGALRLPSCQPAIVKRCAMAIRALCYGPSGAIAAAATTSLPEAVGGCRNWDYRFCWPRDAAMAAAALVRLGNTGVALRLTDWLLGVLATLESPDRLRPVYTVGGNELGAEAEIGELRGYAGSTPVRVGNAAAQQVQLDVFGPIADLVALMGVQGAPFTPDHWRLVQAMVAAVESRWQEPDHGIWELRGDRRQHVHTKVMCWQTMDRAITIADLQMGHIPPEWLALRQTIADEVLERGFNRDLGAFTTAYDNPDIDAAALHVGLSGLLPPQDPRFVSTVQAVERKLREGPTVWRYRFDDGLPGREGGFHICAGWLAECYTMLGRHEEAASLLDSICKLAGPLGLLSEQFDPGSGAGLGNHAQAYSQLAVINAAVRLATASAGS